MGKKGSHGPHKKKTTPPLTTAGELNRAAAETSAKQAAALRVIAHTLYALADQLLRMTRPPN